LPENFDAPYAARSLQDFWRRWHISLSSWLRDYLYVPLGGSRYGSFKTYRNLMITMVLGGLWHGASWNFVIWGALHGGGLAATRMWQRMRAQPGERAGGWLGQGLAVLLTFHFVCLAWVFFRAPTLGHAWLTLSRIVRGTGGTSNLSPRVVALVVLGLSLHAWPKSWTEGVRERFVRTPAVVQGALLAVLAYGLHVAAGAKAEPFVYGQF
jgi:alginate O-acetyltransferase complex protein AlgI